ncbi:hypothetical protein [Antarctobacter jejuensis]|uniref:hypothetical protein n=1 Tax=Antarctobacter jejuensis TaxID=1439938 RepID=UPI003FD092AB
MTRILFTAAALTIGTLAASTASAGCSPACKSGETCRYEAAGDKYYCAATKGFQAGGKSIVPGTMSTTGPTTKLRTLGK